LPSGGNPSRRCAARLPGNIPGFLCTDQFFLVFSIGGEEDRSGSDDSCFRNFADIGVSSMGGYDVFNHSISGRNSGHESGDRSFMDDFVNQYICALGQFY
jgi:hypothetical protein